MVSLRENLLNRYHSGQMQDAGTGNGEISHNKSVRGDKIFWLDRGHQNKIEDEFLNIIESFVVHLNSTCYTNISGYEFHFTLYEEGSYYRKHLDQFRNNNRRAFTMIIYLNTDWLPEHGGELRIHHHETLQTISPVFNRCVFFRSTEVAHEVLLNNRPRYSIAGWLKMG